jgi:hypothetical protein
LTDCTAPGVSCSGWKETIERDLQPISLHWSAETTSSFAQLVLITKRSAPSTVKRASGNPHRESIVAGISTEQRQPAIMMTYHASAEGRGQSTPVSLLIAVRAGISQCLPVEQLPARM